MRSNVSLSKPDALMAGPQSRRKVKKSRWTNAEALNRRRGKSPEEVRLGVNSRHGKPLEKQVVLRLQELCRAILDVHSLKGNVAKTASTTGSAASQVKEELKECILPVVEISTVSKKESEMIHSEVNGISAPSQGNEGGAHSVVKLAIAETKTWKEQENKLSLENADVHKVIKTESELDVDSIISKTDSCKIETVDCQVDVGHKVERKDVECVEENGGPIALTVTGHLEEQFDKSNQNKVFSNTLNNIILCNVSRAEYHYCKEHDGIYADPINLANQSESSFAVAADEGVLDSVTCNGVGYSTDEEAAISHTDIQKFSGPRFWVGKGKRVSYGSTSSSTDESLDSLVSSGMSMRESLPGLKNDHLKDDVPYDMRNCGMVIDSDRDKLFYQEISDLWSTTSTQVSRHDPPVASLELTDANSYRCVSHIQSWSPSLLPVTSSGRIGSYLEPGTEIPLQYGMKTSETLAGSLCQDVHVLQSAIPTSFPAMPVSPAAPVSKEGMGQETETLKCEEGELFRRIEESLAERETLKYQEKELLKRIERSLTETKSLKCREEQLLNNIERSLTRAKSLKSQEEELLRRIEMSLAHRGTVKSQDEELFVRMETLKDMKYNFVDADSVSSMEFESENMPDIENSLPLKKRKKWLKSVTDNEKKEMQISSSPLESFPSFPSWPMISIAELEAVSKVQQHPSFPSFPSRPMISIAELEARTAFGKLEQQPCESPVAAPWIQRHPCYCEESGFCGESFCSTNSVGRTFKEFFEQNSEKIENTMVFPLFKTEESAERYSCCKRSRGCTLSQSGLCDVAYLRRVGAFADETALSVCSAVAEDSRVNFHPFLGPATDPVGSTVEVDSIGGVESCERTSGPSVGLYKVDTDLKYIVGTEETVRHSDCTKDNSEGTDVTVGVPDCTKDDKIVWMDAKNCTEVNREVETSSELKCIKVEADSKENIEHCGLPYPPVTDMNYKAGVDSETSVTPSSCTKVDVEPDHCRSLLSGAGNCAEAPKGMVCEGLEDNLELLGKSEENLECSKKTKDNAECWEEIDTPLNGSKCAVDTVSKEGFL